MSAWGAFSASILPALSIGSVGAVFGFIVSPFIQDVLDAKRQRRAAEIARHEREALEVCADIRIRLRIAQKAEALLAFLASGSSNSSNYPEPEEWRRAYEALLALVDTDEAARALGENYEAFVRTLFSNERTLEIYATQRSAYDKLVSQPPVNRSDLWNSIARQHEVLGAATWCLARELECIKPKWGASSFIARAEAMMDYDVVDLYVDALAERIPGVTPGPVPDSDKWTA